MLKYWTVSCMNPRTPGRGSLVVFGPLASLPTAEMLRTADSLLSESLMLSLGEQLLLVGSGLTVAEHGTHFRLTVGTMERILTDALSATVASDTLSSAST